MCVFSRHSHNQFSHGLVERSRLLHMVVACLLLRITHQQVRRNSPSSRSFFSLAHIASPFSLDDFGDIQHRLTVCERRRAGSGSSVAVSNCSTRIQNRGCAKEIARLVGIPLENEEYGSEERRLTYLKVPNVTDYEKTTTHLSVVFWGLPHQAGLIAVVSEVS